MGSVDRVEMSPWATVASSASRFEGDPFGKSREFVTDPAQQNCCVHEVARSSFVRVAEHDESLADVLEELREQPRLIL